MRRIHITDFDLYRLLELVEVAQTFGSSTRHDFDELLRELERAEVVKPRWIPPDVVTMNSRVRLCSRPDDELFERTLVFPADSATDASRLSILDPLGTALLGCQAGSRVDWVEPSGRKSVSVVSVVFQPEASGNFNL